MYLLIAWVWFLFAARCMLSICYFSLASSFAAFFVVNSFVARKLANTCTKQGKNWANNRGKKKVKS